MLNTKTRPTALTLKRSEWESHPNWPAQVLLLGSHNSFKRFSAMLIEEAKTQLHSWRSELDFRRWISGMRSHEHYEERKLYPYLTKRFGLSFENAEAGHKALHKACEGVLAAFDAHSGAADEESQRTVVKTLEVHDEILRAHLTLEEEIVIPALLELSPQEFEAYYRNPLSVLLARLN